MVYFVVAKTLPTDVATEIWAFVQMMLVWNVDVQAYDDVVDLVVVIWICVFYLENILDHSKKYMNLYL